MRYHALYMLTVSKCGPKVINSFHGRVLVSATHIYKKDQYIIDKKIPADVHSQINNSLAGIDPNENLASRQAVAIVLYCTRSALYAAEHAQCNAYRNRTGVVEDIAGVRSAAAPPTWKLICSRGTQSKHRARSRILVRDATSSKLTCFNKLERDTRQTVHMEYSCCASCSIGFCCESLALQ